MRRRPGPRPRRTGAEGALALKNDLVPSLGPIKPVGLNRRRIKGEWFRNHRLVFDEHIGQGRAGACRGHVQGLLDLDDSVPVGYEQIQIKMDIKADCSEEVLEELVAFAKNHSPVCNTVCRPVPVTVNRVR